MLKRKLPFLLLCYSGLSVALSWNDVWYNKFHQGVNNYRAKNYQQAIDQFSNYDNATANYNRGNALAYSEKYKEAIDAYDKALQQNPKMADAEFNREIIKKLLENQKEQNKQENKQNKEDQKNNQTSNDQQQKKEDEKHSKQPSEPKEDPKDKQQSSGEDKKNDEKQDEQKKNEPKKNEDNQQQDRQKERKRQKLAEQKMSDQSPKKPEQSQADQQILNRVPDDPGGLLRRKFQRDYERRQLERRGW